MTVLITTCVGIEIFERSFSMNSEIETFGKQLNSVWSPRVERVIECIDNLNESTNSISLDACEIF